MIHDVCKASSNPEMADDFHTVGFIGLGAMGMPMVQNLAKKLPAASHIFVHDVSQDAVQQLVAEFPDRVSACNSAREVAEKTVRE